ncbi:COG3014 family protein [Desulforegula conservatrix]|uniref:COG3014 family protein n=1 Tax=Desulforegula conservatrix TaxID=153026 RepID=UPI000414A162|nr:hypothetical protein [Desulforegula conservatrix]
MQIENNNKYSFIKYVFINTLFICILLISGCAPVIDYKSASRMLATRDCEGAKQILSQDKYGSKNQLLFLMDSGILNMQCGDYKKAVDFFSKASELGDDLWTESVSSNILSFVTNDLVLPYQGEDFERVMLPLFSGLCYMKLDRYDEALVDFKKLDIILGEMNSRYDSKNIYKEDALARYLGGALYESFGKYDDAFIDYYKAFRIYRDYQRDYGMKIPDFAAQDLIYAGKKSGRLNEAIELMGADYYKTVPPIDTASKGKVVYITFAGSSPVKHDDRIVLPSHVGPITVAFPIMLPSSIPCRPSSILIQGADQSYNARLETAENINSIAMKNLEDRRARYIAKALARATAKQVVIHQIGTRSTDHEDTRNLIKIFLNIMNLFLEQADTRSWRTLPGEIIISRFYLPKGTFSIKSKGCPALSDYDRKVEIVPGSTTFIVNETAVSGF